MWLPHQLQPPMAKTSMGSKASHTVATNSLTLIHRVGQACMAIGEEEVASIIKVVPVAGEVTTKDLPRRWPTPYLSPTCQRMLARFSWLSILVPLD